ncbi:hypothetical protein FHG87_021112 [Trinorchestia longiramus]|nr:hypothetical protein FHG87_021112 [Trinorchestia longiramus]
MVLALYPYQFLAVVRSWLITITGGNIISITAKDLLSYRETLQDLTIWLLRNLFSRNKPTICLYKKSATFKNRLDKFWTTNPPSTTSY